MRRSRNYNIKLQGNERLAAALIESLVDTERPVDKQNAAGMWWQAGGVYYNP
jgi:hypothetical protein